MGIPFIKSGKLVVGENVSFGEGVTIDVTEEIIIGDRCVIGDNAYFGGRRVDIGSDFYGYSWEWKRLDIGRGRRDEEDAILTIGDKCTMHDNKIDLARRVTISNNVGLSPEVTIYTHHYWQSCIDGYPCRYAPVTIMDGAIIGYRSVILPGATIGPNVVVGAQSVVSRFLREGQVYGGNPARWIKTVVSPSLAEQKVMMALILEDYRKSLDYRGIKETAPQLDWPIIKWSTRLNSISFNLDTMTLVGYEDELSDDLRLFLFKRGIRLFTKRPFRSLGRVQ